MSSLNIEFNHNWNHPDWVFQFHRSLESLYSDLPWPQDIKHIAVVTEVASGKGDVAAAAKVVDVVQKLSPDLDITWRVCSSSHDPKSFLNSSDLSRIHIIQDLSNDKPKNAADFLITGPMNTKKQRRYIEGMYSGEIRGPRFNFFEFGENHFPDDNRGISVLRSNIRKLNSWPLFNPYQIVFGFSKESVDSLYPPIHNHLFSASADLDGIIMGLENGSGVLFDENRASTQLSRKSCCPKYLQYIQDRELKTDVLNSLGVENENELPNYDNVSLSFGYAHYPKSWKRFISFVAIQEQKKDVAIVINHKSAFSLHQYDIQGFCDVIFTPDFLSLLEKYGYGQVKIKGAEEKPIVIQTGSTIGLRTLNLVIRPSFLPSDVKHLQLASDRILSTGDNSPIESWAARCSFYMYESISYIKKKFLTQQVALAKTQHPIFARFLELSSKENDLTEDEMSEAVKLLSNHQLPEETLAFCEYVSSYHSFNKIVVGALKRTAWHHCLPNLLSVEADALDQQFKAKVITCLQSSINWSEEISDKQLQEMLGRVKEKVKSVVIQF